MQGLWQHPQLQAREHWREVDSPVGPLRAPLPPGRHSGFAYRMDGIPALGADTDRILHELGLSAERMAALRAANAV